MLTKANQTRDQYHHLYHTPRWRKARKAYLNKHPLCVMCEKRGLTVAATVVDHKKPHKGNLELFWDEDNWQPLCKQCHDSVKKMQEIHGYSQACGVDGLPIDAGHPWNR